MQTPVIKVAAEVLIVAPMYQQDSRLRIQLGPDYALCIETSGDCATGEFTIKQGFKEIWRGTDPTTMLLSLGLTEIPPADPMAGAAEYYRPGVFNGD
jgi:hypothetical protein